MKEGKGTMTYPNGYKKEGKWDDDKFKKGEVRMKIDGGIYEGKYKKGERKGYGVFKLKDG